MPETKATLGAEPFQRLIGETDISYNYKPEFIDNILDKLPLLRTSSASSFSFSSEGAISLPNPNTRGLTYLDDFEKTTLSQDVSMRGLLWQFASVPADQDTSTFARERLFWFNPTTRLRKDSIFGSGIGEEGKEMVDYLKIYYTPNINSSWAGFMTCVSQTGWNLRDIENLEVILRSNQRNTLSGTIHFSIATRIDEDAPRRTKYGTIAGFNNLQDKEDRNNNGILDEGLGEDSGLDTIIGADNQDVSGDDGNDDYNAITNPMGSEGNRRLDDEDIDQNGYSRNNDYFEYSISLSDSSFFTTLSNNWKLLRIPLTDSVILRDPSKFNIEGTPRWEDIRIVRVWFSDFDAPETMDIYSLAFVGSRWRNARVIQPDTITNPTQPVDSTEKVLVASISQKTDPSYISPIEPRKDATGKLEFEASLAMTYDAIKSGHIAIVAKNNLEREDYRDYQKIKIYVHNDINNPNFTFRFGGDSLNFYEYKAPINRGNLVPARDNLWYEFEISLDSAVFIKSQKDTFKNLVIGNYRAYGSPSLADIRYQALAIENPSQARISGSVWFGDIRLTNPRAEAGFGFQSSATLSFSDLASANISFVYSDPNFRRFSEGRGVKTGGFGTNINYSVRAALDRFFPASWGLSIPVSFQQSVARTLPKYSSKYSDLRLSDADSITKQEKSANNNQQWSLNGLSKAKSRNPILNYTIEAMSLSFGQRKTNSLTMLNTDTAFSRFGSVDYQIAPEIKISLFDNEISLFPNSIRAGIDFTDSRAKPYTRRSVQDTFGLIRTDSTRNADVGFDVEYSPIDDLDFSYSNSASRDLFVPPGALGVTKIGGLNLGVETDNEESFSANYEIELFDILKPRINYDGQYNEDHPKIRGEYDSIRNFNNSSNIDISGEFNLPGVFEKIGDIGGASAVNKAMNTLSSIFQSIDLNYSQDWSANVISATRRPSLLSRIGFGPYDSSKIRSQQASRQQGEDFSASTGVSIKDISMNIKFNQAIDRNIYTYDINGNKTITWPEIGLSLARIERFLFGLATSSNISTSYRLEQRQSGAILGDSFSLVGKRQGLSRGFSPLVSWQITWKSRLSTTFSTSHTQSFEDVFLTNGFVTSKTTQSGANASLSYTFSAPKGIPLPFLRKVRLPSDLGLTWNVRYSKTYSANIDINKQEVPSRNDRNIVTDISASYRLSNSVESGLSTGYSIYNDIQRGRTTKNVDLNFWVLFKF